MHPWVHLSPPHSPKRSVHTPQGSAPPLVYGAAFTTGSIYACDTPRPGGGVRGAEIAGSHSPQILCFPPARFQALSGSKPFQNAGYLPPRGHLPWESVVMAEDSVYSVWFKSLPPPLPLPTNRREAILPVQCHVLRKVSGLDEVRALLMAHSTTGFSGIQFLV